MRDSIVERQLERQGIAFDYSESVPIADILIDEAAQNNIRIKDGKIHSETVEQYAEAMRNGDEFPAIIVYRNEANRLGVIGGLHRLTAKKTNQNTHTDCYILRLDCREEMTIIRRLQRTLNGAEGGGYTLEERLLQALALMDELNMSQADAAKTMNIKLRQLQYCVEKNRTEQRFRKAGIEPTKIKVLETTQKILAKIKQDHYFVLSVKMAQESLLPVEEAKRLVHEIEEAQSDVERDLIIQQWRVNLAPIIRETAGGKIKSPSSPIRKFSEVLKRMERWVGKPDLKSSAKATGHAEMTRVGLLLGKIIRGLIGMYKDLLVDNPQSGEEYAQTEREIQIFESMDDRPSGTP